MGTIEQLCDSGQTRDTLGASIFLFWGQKSHTLGVFLLINDA